MKLKLLIKCTVMAAFALGVSINQGCALGSKKSPAKAVAADCSAFDSFPEYVSQKSDADKFATAHCTKASAPAMNQGSPLKGKSSADNTCCRFIGKANLCYIAATKEGTTAAVVTKACKPIKVDGQAAMDAVGSSVADPAADSSDASGDDAPPPDDGSSDQ